MDDKETLTGTLSCVNDSTLETKNINHVIFILFAEYLGYTSPLIEWCEKICNGSYPQLFVTNILKIEAKMIFKQMQEEYPIEKIKKWFHDFYPLILEEYDLKLKEREKTDLPF